jgi:hypothetical protein
MLNDKNFAPQINRPEKEKYPEVLTGQEVADLVKNLSEQCSPLLAEHLVKSNVVLTLAGLKPMTEFPIKVKDAEDVAQIQNDIDKLNKYLAQEQKNIMFLKITNKPFIIGGSESEEKAVLLDLYNLSGFERISKISKIPGLTPFYSNQGFEILFTWAKEIVPKLQKAKDEGLIPQNYDPENLFDGIIRGYPDQAIYDYADALSKNDIENMSESRIPNTGRYEEAQPNYDFYPEHAEDPAIKKNIAEAGKILEDFYASKWHSELNT